MPRMDSLLCIEINFVLFILSSGGIPLYSVCYQVYRDTFKFKTGLICVSIYNIESFKTSGNSMASSSRVYVLTFCSLISSVLLSFFLSALSLPLSLL